MITILKDVYTKKECDDLIAYSEDIGYSNDLVNKFNEYFYEPEFRNDQGVGIENVKIANTLLNRITEHIKESNTRINPLVRFSKYLNGGKVSSHQDYEITIDGYTSKYTVLLYLNDAKGGETVFGDQDPDPNVKVGCKMGQVVIFDQSLSHKANVAETIKYTMRTDILVDTLPNFFDSKRKELPPGRFD